MKKDYSGIIFGIVIAAIGIILSGNILEIWDIDMFFDGWWTLLLIIPGLISILRHEFNFGSGIMVIIGIMLLLDSQDILDGRIMWRMVFPLILVAIGIAVITSSFRKDKVRVKVEYNKADNGESYHYNKKKYSYDNSSCPQYRALFGGGEIKNTCDNLKSVTVEAIFGGFELDLRDAKINEDISLDIKAIFGGVDIYLPSNVEIVIISGTPILGGASFRQNRVQPGAPKVIVRYVIILGGAEIQ